MKAQVLSSPKRIEEKPLVLEDLPIPSPKRGEVRLKVHCCGLCLTDRHICEGELTPRHPKIIPGHQVVGVVESSLGNRFQKGELVGAVWLGSTCGLCRYCRSGRENLCEQAAFTGWDFHGGYAEYMVAREEFLHPLPTHMKKEEIAPLLCAGVIGYRSLRIVGADRGAKLGLYGFGNSAHIVMQIATYLQIECYAFSRNLRHLEIAKRLGAHWVGDIHEASPEKLSHAIIFAPRGEMVTKALLDLDRGGKIGVNAIHMNDIPSMRYEDLYYEKSIQSVTHGTRKDARDLFSLLKECPIQTEVETFPLEQANEALLKLKQSDLSIAGVIVV